MDTTRQDEPPTTGGQWNFSGVLYQLLVTLMSGLSATVEEIETGADAASVRIIVEPHHGGDNRLHRPSGHRVDQIKIRRGGTPWTTRTIVENVLPDLFKASHSQVRPSRYRFVTDNLDGTESFAGFIALVRSLDVASKGIAGLDTGGRGLRWGNEAISAAELFDRIARTLNAPAQELWLFLASVEIVGWSEATVIAEIDAILCELVDERDEIPLKRKAFGQHLLGLGKVGASISGEALLRVVDLDSSRLTLARRLPALLREQIHDAVLKAQYNAAMDVRALPVLPEEPLSVLTGDSGQGKTWRLCRAALGRAEAGRCALLLRAQGTIADLEAKIVEQLWRIAFDRALPLARIAERLRPKLADEKDVWLTLYLDDLADSQLAEELAHIPWATLGH